MSSAGTELLGVVRFQSQLDRDRILLLFVSANLAFLAIDVAVAHSVNSFRPVYEWIPVFVPPFGALTAAMLALHRSPSNTLRWLHVLMMLTSIGVGLLGTAFHLWAALGVHGGIEWSWLVFSAPVLAPLSFAGVGLVGLVATMTEDAPGSGRLSLASTITVQAPISKTEHLLWFVALGFLGATLTSFLDHGQYGHTLYEWIPVLAGAYATVVVIGRALLPEPSRGDNITYFWTMVAQIVVGVAGFAFHLSRDLADSGAVSIERMRSFAPIFAPLLFCDLGILGLLVLLATGDRASSGSTADAPRPPEQTAS